jgi:hypothetical protein
MSQSGTEVTGSFTHASGSGTIKGKVKGQTLTFTYTYQGGEGFSETGKGTFVISSDNKTFSGTYSSDLKDGVKGNGWRGHKLSGMPVSSIGAGGSFDSALHARAESTETVGGDCRPNCHPLLASDRSDDREPSVPGSDRRIRERDAERLGRPRCLSQLFKAKSH